MPSSGRIDITRVTLHVASIGALTVASFLTLRPFLGAAIWATMVVVATWPLLLKLQKAFRGHRLPAVIVMCTANLLVLVVPLTLAVSTIVENAPKVTAWIQGVAANGLPPAPAWFAKIPMVGDRIIEQWNALAAAGAGGMPAELQPYLSDGFHWVMGAVGSVGGVVVQFLVMIGIAAVMYVQGETAVKGIRAFGTRLAGENGSRIVSLAGQSIRGIALGVIVTALIQAAIGGIALAIAGVPYAAVLVVLIFMCCIIQIGPLPVLVPAVIWVYAQDETTLGTVLLVLSIFAGTVDNVIRPFLIKRGGADLSLLLIIPGVIGGVIAFGLLGLFIGPLVLAVTFTLLQAWMRGGENA